MTTDRFTKIAADGKPLPADAPEWDAVADSRTGLMWAKDVIRVSNWKPATIKKIEKQLNALRTGGFDDWRIPDVEELFLLTDRTRTVRPTIDVDFFPDCPSDWFWSSTPYAPSPGGCAWVVYFGNGSADYNYRGFDGFVRAVRGGQ